MFRYIFIGFIFLGFFSMPNFSLGATAETVQAQIDDIASQIQKLDQEIAKYQAEIGKTSEQSKTLSNLIKELTLSRDKLVKEKTVTEKKITSTGLVITSLTTDINTKVKSIDNEHGTISRLLYNIYQNDQKSFIENVLSRKDLSEISSEYNNIVSFNDKLRDNINILAKEKETLGLTKDKKVVEEKSLKDLKSKLTKQQQAVEIAKAEKNKLLTETKNQEANYKKLLAEQLKKKETFENSLREYEAQLKFILNPKLLPKEGSGVLSWPLDSILITSPYSARWGKFHYGVDFRASIGTSVKAMASGEVMGTGDTDISCKGASFGKWVFIKYNNGLSSTYGHLSVITAKIGQKVETGDVVGLSGNTGYSTGPHLHVAVYASGGVKVDTVPSKSCGGKIFTQPIAALNAYLNPLLYLPKTLASMFK